MGSRGLLAITPGLLEAQSMVDPEMASGVWHHSARVTDGEALGRLLARLPPEVTELARKLLEAEGMGAMRYDPVTQKAYWLQHTDTGIFAVATFDRILDKDMARRIQTAILANEPVDEAMLILIYGSITGYTVLPVASRGN